MSEKLQRIQAGIKARQIELQRAADILARDAHRFRSRGALVRVALIVLGALTASQAALDKLGVVPAQYLGVVFLLIGVLVAALAGIETAFKFESKGSELIQLAAGCHSMVRQTDSLWSKRVGIEEDAEKEIAGAIEVLELQEGHLQEVQEKAAAIGVNIALEVRRPYRKSLRNVGRDDDDDDDTDDDSDDSSGGRGPYAA